MRPRCLILFFCCAALVALPACVECCGDTVAGSSSDPLTLEPLVFTEEGAWIPFEEGGTLPTILGGQGFTMVVVGAKAQNVDMCGTTLSARLTETETGNVLDDVTLERRLIQTDETSAQTRDTDGESGLQVIPCGQYFARCTPVPIVMEVTLTDRAGKTATVQRSGMLDCREPWTPCDGVDGGTP